MRMEQSGATLVILRRGDQSGRELVWDVALYEKTRYADVVDIFKEINGFWEYLGHERCEDIWNVFQMIHTTLHSNMEFVKQTRQLVQLTSDLYDLFTLDELKRWMTLYDHVRVPPDVKEKYGPEDIQARTYLREDYVDLAVLAVALRPMVPIWGEYIFRTKEENTRNFKELAAFRLLSKSKLIVCTPMVRLRRYVEATLENEAPTAAPILSGMGSAERPEWIQAMTVIRRVAPGDLSTSDDKGNLIKNIHTFVQGTIKDTDRKFGGSIREKYAAMGDKEDDSTSFFELVKVKQQVSIGEAAIYNAYAGDYGGLPNGEWGILNLAHHIDPTIDTMKLELCIRNAQRLQDIEVHTHALVIVQWVVNKAMPAQSVMLLDKPALLSLYGVVQALLWHWGMVELAILITAGINPDDQNRQIMESRSRIPAELVMKLNEIYPYEENTGRTRGQVKNVGVKSIQLLAKELSVPKWLVRAPSELLEECPLVEVRHNRMVTPFNILEHLARLIIKINGR